MTYFECMDQALEECIPHAKDLSDEEFTAEAKRVQEQVKARADELYKEHKEAIWGPLQ